MTRKEAVSLSMGDRNSPLEADIQADATTLHPQVGSKIEVSRFAGGTLKEHRGKGATITAVILRFGQVVGLKVQVKGGSEEAGPLKDFYIDRCLVEDAQTPTATSTAVREGVSHWSQQRDYWHIDTGGLEALAFAMASVTPTAIATPHPWGWDFSVPEPMRGDFTQVRCIAYQHNNFWTMATAVSPIRGGLQPVVQPIEDHWARTFHWTHTIAKSMAERFDWPWDQAVRSIETRAAASAKILVPMVNEALARCLAARQEITGTAPDVGDVSAGFSVVRLKAGTIGLTEPPSDRRPYTVISIDPAAAKNPEYLRQVVLHECAHIAVASDGGPPHNDLFLRISKAVGLKPEHRD
tara:strand:- start:783 stop:1838 length:1056 start_codon:yes stop_codon:yes gene_type:complete